MLQDNSKLKDNGNLKIEPDVVLDRRSRGLRNRDIVEVLVKWKNYPVEDATESETVIEIKRLLRMQIVVARGWSGGLGFSILYSNS